MPSDSKHPDLLGARIHGYDLARGIAVFGMFFMNFKLVMHLPAGSVSGFWPLFFQAWEGRFGALFVILAGIGISLMTRRARLTKDRQLLKVKQAVLLRRAGFLFVTGLIFSVGWQADILHFYGIYIALSLMVITWSDRRLVSLIAVVGLIFTLMFIFIDWEQNWDWTSLTYQNIWTLSGFILNTFYNGFHPVFPWFGFLLFGMLIGRIDLTKKETQFRYLLGAGTIAIIVESVAYGLAPFWENELLLLFFSTLAFPPLPLFMVSGACTSLVVIILCLMVSQSAPDSLIRPLVQTGQMVLTHYIAHVVIAMAVLEAFGLLYNRSMREALCVSIGYFIMSVCFSMVWQKYFAKGPMESLMRKIAG